MRVYCQFDIVDKTAKFLYYYPQTCNERVWFQNAMSDNRLWSTVLGEVELSISRASYRTWFQNTHLIDQTDNEITVGVPNIFTKKQMEDKYSETLEQILRKNGVDNKKLVFTIKDKPTGHQSPDDISLSADSEPDETTPDTDNQRRSPGQNQTQLSQRYRFSTFIVGSSNELAHAACQAITKQPGKKYNPLFLYGGSGLGKTHLIQAVGNEVMATHPDINVIYVTCEQFVKEFLDSIRYRRKGFSDKYRNADVLIIDDIQFIAGKERTEEEFFHTFNTLHQSNKQIILTSDKPPKSIPTLEERLRSRFEWGMTIDIQPPDFETRCAIIQEKASENSLVLDQDTVDFIATHVQSNIRELEGSLNQIIAYCELKNVPPTVEVAQSLLGARPNQPKRLTQKAVVERTARYFSIEIDELTGPKRDKDIVVPRQIAMYLLRSELHLSFPKVARALGRKDHTTAIHSVEKIEKLTSLDQTIRQQVNDIKERLYA